MSDESSTGGDIFTIPASGGVDPHNLTPNRKGSPAWLRFLPSGKILFDETVDGGMAIANLDPATRVAETIWTGDESLRGTDEISTSNDGKVIASIRSSWSLAPEVWARPGRRMDPAHARQRRPEALWGKTEKLHWRSDDFRVEGWRRCIRSTTIPQRNIR